MKIFKWTAPRAYGLTANIMLSIAWVAMFFFLVWTAGTGRPVPGITFIIGFVSMLGSGIITVALSTTVPEYWEELDHLMVLQDEATKARQEYESAKDLLIKATLKEDYPLGEPSYD
jgi:hypothetical protein